MKTKTIILLSIYTLINVLFIYKYGLRQDFINVWILILSYIGSITFAFFLYTKNAQNSKQKLEKILNKYFWPIVLIIGIIFTFIISQIDSESLHVDRWSAMELTVEGILYGQYPYTIPDHLGNMSSNFPALGYLAIPFYLLGDVGYLQVFVFLLLAHYLDKNVKKPLKKYGVLLLYLLSPAVLWEIAVKSDLMSNMILVCLFIEYWIKKHTHNLYQKPIFLAILIAFLFLTRGTILIPIILFFFKDFWSTTIKTKLTFILSFFLTVIIISLPILLSAPDAETLLEYNPIILQTNKTPVIAYFLFVICLILPYFISNKVNYYFYSSLIILAFSLSSFFVFLFNYGWEETIMKHYIDLSYFSMSFPFIFFYLAKDNSLHLPDKGI